MASEVTFHYTSAVSKLTQAQITAAGDNGIVFIPGQNLIYARGAYYGIPENKNITSGTAQTTTTALSWGGTLLIPSITYDAYGRITGSSTTSVTIPANPNTDTHHTSYTFIGSNAKATANEATTNNTYLNHVENGTVRSSHKIIGSNNIDISSNANGELTISGVKLAPLISPNLSGTPTAPTAVEGTNTTQIATTAFVQKEIGDKIAAADAMIYKGTLGTGGTFTTLPTTYKVGYTYKIITAGTYAGVKCEIGDMLIAIADSTGTANNAHWTVILANIDGAVTGPASVTKDTVAIFDGSTGKLIKSSEFTLGCSVPSGAKFTDTVYSHPAGSGASKASGFYKFSTDSTSHISGVAVVTKADITALGIPDSDTHYTTTLVCAKTNTGSANEVTTNDSTFLNLFDDTTKRSSLQLIGSGTVSVAADATGKITITGSNTVTNATNATNAATASKLGSATVGSGVKPIYLNAGTATASTSTVGSGVKPIYLNAGTITHSTSTVGSATTPVFLKDGTITACSKLATESSVSDLEKRVAALEAALTWVDLDDK